MVQTLTVFDSVLEYSACVKQHYFSNFENFFFETKFCTRVILKKSPKLTA